MVVVRNVMSSSGKVNTVVGRSISACILEERSSKTANARKCPTGVPSLDGKSCNPDCPEGERALSCFTAVYSHSELGQEKNDQGGCCPKGQKPKPGGDACECPAGQKPKATGDGCEDDPEKKRKSKCPGTTVLDPKEGQDPDTPNPKCQIDDEADCKKPKIPATRPEGKENDASYKVDCAEPDKDPNKRAKCPKTHYVYSRLPKVC